MDTRKRPYFFNNQKKNKLKEMTKTKAKKNRSREEEW
jgi:hypothetical protein